MIFSQTAMTTLRIENANKGKERAEADIFDQENSLVR